MNFSIVTPSFNQGRFIERTIASVAAQRTSGIRIEHLVFDGGSTDGTIDILERSGDAIRWTSGKDGGQADAVNKGFVGASGDVIGWLNSDDVYYGDAIARVAAFLTAHPAVDVVYGEADHIDVDDRVLEAYPAEPWAFERLKETCFICQPAVFLRRGVIERFGLLDPTLHYCMDYEYWLRIAKSGATFGFFPHKLAGSRLYAENKTLGSRVAVHREINDMFVRVFGRVPDTWLFAYAHAVVEHRPSARSSRHRFAMHVGFAALTAAMGWNCRISGAMMKTIASHLKRAVLRQGRHDV